MTFSELYEKNKDESDQIKVALYNKNQLSEFLKAPEQIYFGLLSEAPLYLFPFDVVEVAEICESTIPERKGAFSILLDVRNEDE